MVGWVQAIAFSAFGIAVIFAVAVLVENYMDRRHDLRMEKIKHRQELEQSAMEEEQ